MARILLNFMQQFHGGCTAVYEIHYPALHTVDYSVVNMLFLYRSVCKEQVRCKLHIFRIHGQLQCS